MRDAEISSDVRRFLTRIAADAQRVEKQIRARWDDDESARVRKSLLQHTGTVLNAVMSLTQAFTQGGEYGVLVRAPKAKRGGRKNGLLPRARAAHVRWWVIHIAKVMPTPLLLAAAAIATGCEPACGSEGRGALADRYRHFLRELPGASSPKNRS